MRIHRSNAILLAGILCISLLTACYRPSQGPAPLPELNIGVAGFTQPTTTGELLAGYIPDNQGHIDTEMLRTLDAELATVLQTAQRNVTPSEQGRLCQATTSTSLQDTPVSAFEYWLQVGRCMNVDYLLIPQIIHWQERKGESMTASGPAGVNINLFLLDVEGESMISRYQFEETQQSLAENLLGFSKFMERKGKWITARDLAREGLSQGIKELGL